MAKSQEQVKADYAAELARLKATRKPQRMTQLDVRTGAPKKGGK